MKSARNLRSIPRLAPVIGLLLSCMSLCLPEIVFAQTTSPFLTGATSLQANILAWLTPVAVILVMVLGGMAMANRIAQVSSTYGHGDAHTIVENCGNTLILRCSASEGGGTARFASQLIGEREVLRTTIATSRRYGELLGSQTRSQHFSIESTLLPSQIEQLPDLAGYLKHASKPNWRRVALAPAHDGVGHAREIAASTRAHRHTAGQTADRGLE